MSKSEIVVDTLMQVDPDFVQLVEVLYGPDVDAEAVHQDVFAKFAPPADPDEIAAARRKQRINRAGEVIGAAGLGIAAKEGFHGAKQLGQAVRISRGTLEYVPKVAKAPSVKGAAVGLGTGAVLAAGDVIGTMAAGENARKGPMAKAAASTADDVAKVPNLIDHAKGVLTQMRGALQPTGAQHAAPPALGGSPQVNQAIGQQAAALRSQPVKSLFGTPKRAAATTGVATAAGMQAKQNKATQQSYASGYNDATMGKRDDTPDLTWAGSFSKFDTDKRLAFGWASVVEKDGLPVVDRQGDYIAPDDMENAAYVYVQKSRIGGDMHKRVPSLAKGATSLHDVTAEDRPHHVADLVESVVFTKEKIAKMGLPPTTPVGWWVGFKVHDDDVWEMVKKGERTGFSIHGRGKRMETSIDELVS